MTKKPHHREVHRTDRHTVEDDPEDNNTEESMPEQEPTPTSTDEPGVTPLAVTPTATGTGTSTGTTSLTMSAVTGTIPLGSTITGTGVPANTIIVSQTSGTTGGAGVYVTNNATTLTSAALSFMSPSGPVKTGTVGIDKAGNVWYLGVSGWYYLTTVTLPLPQSAD